MIRFLTTFNLGYVEFAKNNILNFCKEISTDTNQLILVAMDFESYVIVKDFLQNLNESFTKNIFLKENFISVTKNADFNTPDFFTITHQKLKIIQSEVQNCEILHFFDSDVFFFQNPTEIIIEKMESNDIVFQLDQPFSYHNDLYHNYVCTGNFTIKNNENSLNFLDKIVSRLKGNQNDQEVVFHFLNENCRNIKEYKDCKLDVYNPELVQNGYDTFKSNWKNIPNKICVHANHMIGKEVKINALKSIGAWLI